jgi:threonylcarbamoyladenosine tRNA methylthiotransferase MtaB
VPSFYVKNFGCRAAQADGAAIERQFSSLGLVRTDSPDNAAIVVLNTCTVTASADRDARSDIRKIHRENPGCRIVVTGCYAQRAPEEIAGLPGVSQVVGNSHKHRLADIALGTQPPSAALISISDLRNAESRLFVSDIFAHTRLLAAPVFDAANHRTRPNLKIQDGCNNRCSFCVIPFVRGQSRSMPMDQILREIHPLVSAGYREVVISGINLGRWGRDLPVGQVRRFEDLIRLILSETLLEKLRISSIEPMDWSDELISIMAGSSRIAKHAHVPMQSGSDRVLRMMHRKYRPWHYKEKILSIRQSMPTAAIGADVMVAFPGETDADFEETRKMIEELPITYLHVFTYSPRPGTPAAEMSGKVPPQAAQQRSHTLRNLGRQKNQLFMQSFIGRNLQAITLRNGDQECGSTEAVTDNFLKVKLSSKQEPNQWMNVRVEGFEQETLIGSEEILASVASP